VVCLIAGGKLCFEEKVALLVPSQTSDVALLVDGPSTFVGLAALQLYRLAAQLAGYRHAGRLIQTLARRLREVIGFLAEGAEFVAIILMNNGFAHSGHHLCGFVTHRT
jgi:hypothetical protein